LLYVAKQYEKAWDVGCPAITKGGDRRMKKLLTVTLMFVFAMALVFALGCSKKQETTNTETGTGTGMEQTTPPMTDTTGMAPPADTTGMTH
jgi:hypothetical protein